MAKHVAMVETSHRTGNLSAAHSEKSTTSSENALSLTKAEASLKTRKYFKNPITNLIFHDQ